MTLVKKFEFKLNIIGWITQLAPFVLIAFFIPLNSIKNPIFIVTVMSLLILNRFPHECFHKLAASLMGFESIINFKSKNPTCTPIGILKWNQVLKFSLTPFILLSNLCFLMMILSYYISSDIMFYIFLAYFFTQFGTCAGDFGYTYQALKYKGHIFKDTGFILEIYKN